MITYGFIKEVDVPFERTIEKVTLELKLEGFGIMTTIDLKEKFKEKLNMDYKKYVILGVCNPPYAYKSIQTEENIGLMLPCNIIIYEKENKTMVGIIKPTAAMGMIDNEELRNIANEVETKLKKVFDSI